MLVQVGNQPYSIPYLTPTSSTGSKSHNSMAPRIAKQDSSDETRTKHKDKASKHTVVSGGIDLMDIYSAQVYLSVHSSAKC